ncbi:MAG: hypothetical protein KC635_11720 [Myxococcales bacterium]|nr:hypothetical protein [Myxococcales bacterium]
MRLPSLLIALFVALTAATAPACESITGPSELQRKIAHEQEVIAAYSAEVAKVDALQRRFVEAWKAANEQKELKAYRDALEGQVLPALDAYVKAAEAMPTGSPELAEIHKGLVDAYRGARESFQGFTSELSEANVESGYKALLEKMDAVKKAEAAYLEKLKLYYAKNQVDLVPAPESTPARP